MRETDRSQGIGALLVTTAFHRFGSVDTKAIDQDHRHTSSFRVGARTRSAPMRQTASQAGSILSPSVSNASTTSVSPLIKRSVTGEGAGTGDGKAKWEETPYVTPTRVVVPRRRPLTPPPLEKTEVDSDVVDAGTAGSAAADEKRKVRNPATRRRAMGPPADPQMQSALFRLPKAVRVLIYQEVLGGRVLRITGGLEGKLGCLVCEDLGGLAGGKKEPQARLEGIESSLAALNLRGGKEEEEENMRRKKKAESGEGESPLYYLPLMLSCRAIYAEATPHLYTTPTYAFTQIETLLSFSLALPAHHFDSITTLHTTLTYDLSAATGTAITTAHLPHVPCTPRSNWPRWQRAWRVVDSMASLQTLTVRIEWGKELFADEERLLGPLAGVRGLKVFEIEVGRLKSGEHGRFTREEREKARFQRRITAGVKRRVRVVEAPFRLVRREG